jgi:hypothetical protein
MNAREAIKLLLLLVGILTAAASFGAVVANVAPAPERVSIKPRDAHPLTAPRTTVERGPHQARQPDSGEVDITRYVNLYAIGGVLACFGVLAHWGWWQTHRRCPSCGNCPAWCRCGEVTHRHGH